MASRTSLDANVAHHGDRIHHNVVAGAKCLRLEVEACSRGVVYPLQMHRWVFPERPDTSDMELARNWAFLLQTPFSIVHISIGGRVEVLFSFWALC